MSIALLAIGDGRDGYLTRSLASAVSHLHGPITERWLYDDSGDEQYRETLAARYPLWRHINAGPRQGFGGAIRAAWAQLAAHSAAEFVFHLETDFLFQRQVDLGAIATVLRRRPQLMQMALRRQAWNAEEAAAGGVVECHPGAYLERHALEEGWWWLEHRLFWTTNPSLYQRRLCTMDWPHTSASEGIFTHRLLTHGALGVPGEQVQFGYWGARSSGTWVEHIGHDRVGTGY